MRLPRPKASPGLQSTATIPGSWDDHCSMEQMIPTQRDIYSNLIVNSVMTLQTLIPFLSEETTPSSKYVALVPTNSRSSVSSFGLDARGGREDTCSDGVIDLQRLQAALGPTELRGKPQVTQTAELKAFRQATDCFTAGCEGVVVVGGGLAREWRSGKHRAH